MYSITDKWFFLLITITTPGRHWIPNRKRRLGLMTSKIQEVFYFTQCHHKLLHFAVLTLQQNLMLFALFCLVFLFCHYWTSTFPHSKQVMQFIVFSCSVFRKTFCLCDSFRPFYPSFILCFVKLACSLKTFPLLQTLADFILRLSLFTLLCHKSINQSVLQALAHHKVCRTLLTHTMVRNCIQDVSRMHLRQTFQVIISVERLSGLRWRPLQMNTTQYAKPLNASFHQLQIHKWNKTHR